MSATDELRRLLDERGVEWTYADGTVSFNDGERWFHAWAYNDGAMCVSMGYLTPEQAVEATLGRGTCRQIETEEGFIVCSECGAPQPEDYTCYYCWCCGRKVVGA